MFYIEHENKIVLFDQDRERLARTVACMPQYAGAQIQETARPIEDFEFADTPQYAAKKAAAEKAALAEQLQHELDALDLKTIRALRAMSAGAGDSADKDKLEEIEAQAAQIRTQLRELAL